MIILHCDSAPLQAYYQWRSPHCPFPQSRSNSSKWRQDCFLHSAAFQQSMSKLCIFNKKLSYRLGTAWCVVAIEILPIATQFYILQRRVATYSERYFLTDTLSQWCSEIRCETILKSVCICIGLGYDQKLKRVFFIVALYSVKLASSFDGYVSGQFWPATFVNRK